MTTSYLLGHRTIISINSMFLGLHQAVYERSQGKKEEYLWRINLIERKIGEMKKGFGLSSIVEYFSCNPRRWITKLEDIAGKIKGDKFNRYEETKGIESMLAEIKKVLPLPIDIKI